MSLFVMILKHYFCVHSCLEWRNLEGSKVLPSGLPWTSVIVAFPVQDSLKFLESICECPENKGGCYAKSIRDFISTLMSKGRD